MSETLRRVQALVLSGDIRDSEHGYEELGKGGISVEDAIAGIATVVLVEDYPDRFRGRSVFVCSRTAPADLFTWCG